MRSFTLYALFVVMTLHSLALADNCGVSCCYSSSPENFCQICCPLGVAASCMPGGEERLGTCTCQGNTPENLDSPRDGNSAVYGDDYVYASFAMTCALAGGTLAAGVALAYRNWCARAQGEIEL